MNFRKKKKLKNNDTRLRNILSFVEDILKTRDDREYLSIYYIIKIFTDSINTQKNIAVLEGKGDIFLEGKGDIFLFEDDYLFSQSNNVSIDYDLTVELGKAPVITDVWERDRLTNALNNIGTKNCKWVQEPNHKYNLFLPLGITKVHNGNHSANCGIIKATGTIIYHAGANNIYDISNKYSSVYFDGTYYREVNTNAILEEAPFECGCLFEIGRLLKNYKLTYLDLLKLS